MEKRSALTCSLIMVRNPFFPEEQLNVTVGCYLKSLPWITMNEYKLLTYHLPFKVLFKFVFFLKRGYIIFLYIKQKKEYVIEKHLCLIDIFRHADPRGFDLTVALFVALQRENKSKSAKTLTTYYTSSKMYTYHR